LATNFLYGGVAQSNYHEPAHLRKAYVTTIYSSASIPPAHARPRSASANDRLTVNQDQFGDNNGSAFLPTTSRQYHLEHHHLRSAPTSKHFHTYGFANYEVPQPPVANPSFEGGTGAAVFPVSVDHRWTVSGGA